ncbi:MAG: hypothetical protein IJN91_04525 [Alphaproteobacteria bacterium]|nr:hypothetical protein [Alphaproteobacteria bacterium]
MTTINKQHGFYGALAARYDSPVHRQEIWDIAIKRLGQIHSEKSAAEIVDFLNSRTGRHLADEIFDGPGTLSYGVAMLRVAMLNKLKMTKWWAFHTDATPRPIMVDKRILYRSAIKNEMRNRRIRKLVENALACAQDDVWQTPEMWLKSDLTGLDELEMMWTQIQQELKTKGTAHGND